MASTLEVAGAITSVSQTVGVNLQTLMTFDEPATVLPSTAANDDLGIIDGTVGTNAMRLETNDEGGTASQQDFYGAWSWVVPATYKAGSTVTLQVTGGMLRVADQAATTFVDVSAYVPDYANADSSVSSDLCTTAAIIAFNSATIATHSFVIDDDVAGHVLAAGSVVQFQVQVAVDDNGNAGNDITGVINKIAIVVSE